MGNYFGTDGVRGIANQELTPELAFRLGRASGYLFSKSNPRPKVVIGRDTRVSSPMLEGALVAGLLSVGADVMRLGVLPTPGVAYLTKALDAQAGIMISASHNPVQDNGIKFFGSDGYKLSDDEENEIEMYIEQKEDQLPRPIGNQIGKVIDNFEGSRKYLQYVKQTIEEDFSGMHVALDCAHGATSSLAANLFADLGAQLSTMGSSPNGFNINDNVGSTHPEKIADFVREKSADVGFSFDGDGDRVIAVDEEGNLVDGDKILFICAKHLHQLNRLRKSTVVATVMSNLGFHKALKEHGIETLQTQVGDRYVVEELRKSGAILGGEQSGHIVFLEYGTTGDGMLTALQLLAIMKQTGLSLSTLANEMPTYPQLLVNVEVKDKHAIMKRDSVKQVVKETANILGENGRVLVRPSGTESLIRIMVESETEELCKRYVEKIRKVILEKE